MLPIFSFRISAVGILKSIWLLTFTLKLSSRLPKPSEHANLWSRSVLHGGHPTLPC